MPKPWASSPEGLVILVRLTPKGGRDVIEGIEQLADGQSVLKARVRAAASDGEANEALQRLMARTLDIAPRDIVLVAGRTSRIKRLLVRGDARAVAAKLEEIAEVLAK
jgi:uncharacterized protein YggU (UPF0235/DUF167 family)